MTMESIYASNWMRVNVKLRFKGFTKTNKSVASEVAHANNATDDAGTYIMNLLAGANGEHDAVRKAGAACRTFLYGETVPENPHDGLNTGWRLLPVSKAIEFLQKWGQRDAAYNDALAEFKAVYGIRRQQAITNLGDMADQYAYPDVSELDSFFSVTLQMEPIAESAHLPPSLPAELAQELAKNMAQDRLTSIGAVMQDTLMRVDEQVARWVSVMQRKADGEKTKLYGSLLENMETVVDLLDASNVSGDVVVDSVVANIKQHLVPDGRTIDDYKNSDGLCRDVADKAVGIRELISSHATVPQPQAAPVAEQAPGLIDMGKPDPVPSDTTVSELGALMGPSEPDQPGMTELAAAGEPDAAAQTDFGELFAALGVEGVDAFQPTTEPGEDIKGFVEPASPMAVANSLEGAMAALEDEAAPEQAIVNAVVLDEVDEPDEAAPIDAETKAAMDVVDSINWDDAFSF